MMCPSCGSGHLWQQTIYNDLLHSDMVDYYEFTCQECEFIFQVKP